MSELVLTGSFVSLRPLTEDDAEQTLGWRLSDRARFLNAGARSVEEQREWIRGRPASEHNFVIELRDGRAVGMLSLIGIDLQNGHAESARFLIGEPDLVRGIPAAVEAIKLLYDLAFDDLGLARVWGTSASENAMVTRWHKYMGMTEEGRMRRHYRRDGEYQDAILLGILVDEYRSGARARMQALINGAKTRRDSPEQES